MAHIQINKQPVLLIGNVIDDGIVGAIKSSGRSYVNKLLDSRPNNWRKIVSIIDNHDIKQIVAKFTETTLYLCSLVEYHDARSKLFEKIRERSHIIYIYHDIMMGKFSSTREDFSRSDHPWQT